MNPSVCRRPQYLLHLLVNSLCVGFLCGATSINAQSNRAPATASAGEPFDASSLREPVEVGTLGLVQAGDDPAYARPDFDDSKWLPVDATTALNQYFPRSQQPIVWHRLHIRVDPGDAHLALQAYSVSRAFEVYVNGQRLIESGHVEPFVAYTRDARLIVPIPEAQLRTGALLIAVRARTPRILWTYRDPAFNGPMLTMGNKRTLQNQNMLTVIGENGLGVFVDLLALCVGFVALALFIARREQFEYLWIFLLGACYASTLTMLIIETRNLPATWMAFIDLINVAFLLLTVLVFQALLRWRFNWRFWLFTVAACLTPPALHALLEFGILPAEYVQFSQFPYFALFGLILPSRVWTQMRRGNREAGFLLIPLFFYCLEMYAVSAILVLERIPPLRSAAEAVGQFLTLEVGIFSLNSYSMGNLAFFSSLAIIMVLRSTRMSRDQAVLESEVAAARVVQQVIVPERIEAVPGFTIETVYQPAQQVGGDFFQILPTGDGGLLVVVGDVAGKGLPAAMLVSVLVGAIRGVAEYTKNPAELLANLNERLVGRGGFSTALAAHITFDGQVTIANAGHLSPYFDGREVELPGALPLGILSGVTYDTTQFTLAPGSRLTFYSDGVIEAQNTKGELFGFDRAKAISTQPAAAIVEAAKNFGQEDDITVVTIARELPIAAVA